MHARTTRPRARRAAGLALALFGGAVLATAAPSPASAHAALLSTDPEDGASVETAPGEVAATFSEILDEPSTEIAVTGPDETPIEVEPAEFEGDVFIQPMRYTEPGDYTVAFRVISEDGHRVDGSFTFTVATIPDDLLADGAAPETTEAEQTETDTEGEAPAPASTEAADEEDSGMSTGVLVAAILVGALVVAAIGVVAAKLARRGREQ